MNCKASFAFAYVVKQDREGKLHSLYYLAGTGAAITTAEGDSVTVIGWASISLWM